MTINRDYKIKNPRYEERMLPGKSKPKKILQVYLIPGHHYDGYICPAGPGLRPIPKEGKWYDLTDYLWKRLLCGDAQEGDPSRNGVITKSEKKKASKPDKPKKDDKSVRADSKEKNK